MFNSGKITFINWFKKKKRKWANKKQKEYLGPLPFIGLNEKFFLRRKKSKIKQSEENIKKVKWKEKIKASITAKRIKKIFINDKTGGKKTSLAYSTKLLPLQMNFAFVSDFFQTNMDSNQIFGPIIHRCEWMWNLEILNDSNRYWLVDWYAIYTFFFEFIWVVCCLFQS